MNTKKPSGDKTLEEARKTWRELLKRQQNFQYIPKDPYSHQALLLNPYSLSVEELGDLLNQHLLLGNIEDAVLLSYFQEEIYFICSVFGMYKKEKEVFLDLFNLMYFPFVIGIRMTSSLDGMERKIQGFTYHREQAKRRKLVDRIFGRKKKMDVEDYILPEEYWDGN